MKIGRIWTRDRIKRHLVQRFYVRFHMTLILATAGLGAMLGNWIMLHGLSVRGLWIRYPIAVALAYLTFLAGVALWLRYVGVAQRPADAGGDVADDVAQATTDDVTPDVLAGTAGAQAWGQPLEPVPGERRMAASGRRRKSSDDSSVLDGIDLPIGGSSSSPEVFSNAGGSSGGGGASGSWGDALPAVDSGGGGGSSFSLGDIGDLDGDGIVLLLLALALIAAIFFVSGYVIWFAPDILSEAVFGATLAAGLSRSARRNDSEGWVAGVVWKTWWPFAIVLVIAEAVAIFVAANFPEAATLGQAFAMAVGP